MGGKWWENLWGMQGGVENCGKWKRGRRSGLKGQPVESWA